MADAAYLNQANETALPVASGSHVSDFVALLKPRVMTLVVFSGAVGLFIAPGALHPLLAVVAILCIAVGSGAAGAINMWYERDIDALMSRTANRPLPAGRVAPGDALGFATVLAVFSVVLMGFTTNWAAASLLALAILFYVFVYTVWLKRRTPQNIVIGGAAGAFPPVIGWAAVTGDISLVSLSLFAIIFLWTPPHFWALALYRSGDYARAGVPMMPVVAGRQSTKRQMLAYTLLLVPASLVPFALGAAGLLYAIGVAALGVAFIASAWRVLREPDAAEDKRARQMFGFSILYLFLVFALLLADSLLGLAG
ncbi:MAG: protoheme IX farnesyltransferase [Rhodospirillaceae bacterium]|nr:protoheme IX farnesyltransferase [Rhodospirillaceae bacterium]MBT6535026.1 protoheme IX farnesyltransferase [Rhodospirillaceae bacterium]MBT7363114.1 protoheme IX farnesyltransferase [Rhodospirillaceae bacterium]